MIYVGTCGFSYRDWIGPFYPPKSKTPELLSIYARRFRAVEIDATYYGVPTPRTVESLVARTTENFRFAFKAPKTVTHEWGDGVHADAAALRSALVPAAQRGKLACVLTQFPYVFAPGTRSETYLCRTIEAFAGLPVVVEFRNRAWQRPATLRLLHDAGAGYANVDAPDLDALPHPSADVAGPIGYVRFHGRNREQWWHGTNVTRYRYAYAQAELAGWVPRIAEIDAVAGDTYAFFNNHAGGRAAQDAQTLPALLDRGYGPQARNRIAHPDGSPAPEAMRLPL